MPKAIANRFAQLPIVRIERQAFGVQVDRLIERSAFRGVLPGDIKRLGIVDQISKLIHQRIGRRDVVNAAPLQVCLGERWLSRAPVGHRQLVVHD